VDLQGWAFQSSLTQLTGDTAEVSQIFCIMLAQIDVQVQTPIAQSLRCPSMFGPRATGPEKRKGWLGFAEGIAAGFDEDGSKSILAIFRGINMNKLNKPPLTSSITIPGF